MARLSAKYIPGKGDTGNTEPIKGHRLRKDDPACLVQGEIELLRHQIEKLLCAGPLLQPEVQHLLEYLDRNIFSLGSFCWLKGDTTKHHLPEEILDFLHRHTIQIKTKLGNCPDFLSQSHPTLIALDGIRIQTRRLETSYVTWMYSHPIQSSWVLDADLQRAIFFHSAVLNRLSSLLFEALRMEAKLLNDSGLTLAQRVWKAEIEDWSLASLEEVKVLAPAS